MNDIDIHFSSDSKEWSTPQAFYDKLNEEFGFTLDPCATPENAKCTKFFTTEDNGLIQDWTHDIVFMNPPYGREIGKWIKKAYDSTIEGAGGHCQVVCLIPARTDTAYWHDYVMKAQDIRYIRGRLKFSGHVNAAPFPSAVVVFKAKTL